MKMETKRVKSLPRAFLIPVSDGYVPTYVNDPQDQTKFGHLDYVVRNPTWKGMKE